jgi:glycosyltransferase involved in cell wall biosynthesis
MPTHGSADVWLRRRDRVQPLRLAVYTDYPYTTDGEAVYAERAFALFLARLSRSLERMTIVGRLRPDAELGRYRLPRAGFVPLPYYESLARPLDVGRAMFRSMAAFWRALDDADACWLLGPHPLALAFAAIALARRRRVFLGVRQDLPEYVGNRHPGRRAFLLAARMLDAAYRALGRRCPIIVVGPALAERYGASRRMLEIAVSLVEPDDVLSIEQATARSYDHDLTIISVGRIDQEKNPLLLADVLAALLADDPRWRLVVCGEGPLEEPLRARLEALDVDHRARLAGYVEHGEALLQEYRNAHFLLHTSWTEGLPQVLVEALAAGLPVVATDVGGIRKAVGDAVRLVAPGDAPLAAAELRALAGDPTVRERLVSVGLEYARAHTIDAEVERVAAFLVA